MFRSEFEEEHAPLPPLTPAPNKDGKKVDAPKTYQSKTTLPKILPNVTIPIQNQQNGNQKQSTIPSIPFPLLILNGVQTPNNNAEKRDAPKSATTPKNDAGIQNIIFFKIKTAKKCFRY